MYDSVMISFIDYFVRSDLYLFIDFRFVTKHLLWLKLSVIEKCGSVLFKNVQNLHRLSCSLSLADPGEVPPPPPTLKGPDSIVLTHKIFKM